MRIGRNVVPTKFASALEPRVRAIVADLQGLPATGVFDPSREQGFMSLAANVTELGPEILTLRDNLRQLAPQIKFRILELGARENVEHLLTEGKVDLAITVRPPSYPASLQSMGLFEDEFVVFYDANMQGPIETIEDYCLAEHGALDFGGAKPSTIELALQERLLTRTVSLRVSNAQNLGILMTGTKIICSMQRRLQHSTFSHLANCELPFSIQGLKLDLVWHRRDDQDLRSIWLRSIAEKSAAGFNSRPA